MRMRIDPEDRLNIPAIAAGAAVVTWTEWRTDEVTVVLALLVAISFACGLAWPRRALLSGAVLGLAMPLAHVITEALGRFRPSYMFEAPSVSWAAQLLVLVVPALVAAGAGALLRQSTRRLHRL